MSTTETVMAAGGSLAACRYHRASTARVACCFSFVRAAATAGFLSAALVAPSSAQSGPPQPASGTRADSQPAAKVDQRYRYRFLGVYDDASGEPIEGVEVSDMLSGLSSLTSKTGTVSLFFLPEGGSFVRLRKVGYEMQTIPVAISPADTAPVTITLGKTAVTLATVTVKDSAPKYMSPLLRGAEDRIHSHSGGYFIDEAEMRKHDESTLANTMRARFPGILSVTGKHGETYFVSSRHPCVSAMGCATPNCFIRIYLDGIPSTASQPDFSRLSTMDWAVAEFYPGDASLPAGFGGTNSVCGTLLLWSRER